MCFARITSSKNIYSQSISIHSLASLPGSFIAQLRYLSYDYCSLARFYIVETCVCHDPSGQTASPPACSSALYPTLSMAKLLAVHWLAFRTHNEHLSNKIKLCWAKHGIQSTGNILAKLFFLLSQQRFLHHFFIKLFLCSLAVCFSLFFFVSSFCCCWLSLIWRCPFTPWDARARFSYTHTRVSRMYPR